MLEPCGSFWLFCTYIGQSKLGVPYLGSYNPKLSVEMHEAKQRHEAQDRSWSRN